MGETPGGFIDGEAALKKPSKKKTFWKFFLISLLVFVMLFTSGMGIFANLMNQQILDKGSNTTQDTEMGLLIPGEGIFAEEYEDVNRVNVLLLGNTDQKLSDTIMLASFDMDKKKVDIISVPRDTYHPQEGKTDPTTKKINASFSGDPVHMAQAVHDELQGIPINYYAVIDYEGVANIVDSIGGVEIDVPQDMNYTSRNGKLHIDIDEGKQVLDGDKSIQFLRFRRYFDGDLGRVKAQQTFVKEAIKQAMGFNIAKVAKTVIDNVDSDITLKAILYIASKAVNMDADSVESYTLPGYQETFEGLSFYFGKPEEIEIMLREIYSGEKIATDSAISEGALDQEDSENDGVYDEGEQ